jgi:hypothetical protein
MLTRNTIALALAAAMTLGVASVAQASDHENQSGGFRVGPLGQRFAPPRAERYGFAYAPGWGVYRGHDYAYAPWGRRAWRYEY